MPSLLRTKLFLPQKPEGLLSRPQLVDRLHDGLSNKLSLVVAPAGFGKTTLISTWLHQIMAQDQAPKITWLSIDPNDNDMGRFAIYFVEALAQIEPKFEAIGERYSWESDEEASLEQLMVDLINELAILEQTAVLVLDDYHEITNPLIHDALSFWLDNQPPNFHLVITSRNEPPLPLPRMRVRRELTEVDMGDLRFSQQETAVFLNQLMQLDMSDSDVAQLGQITEGWVASLQLASISLKNSSDHASFIQSFKGGNRYIVDYLVSEVLNQQPPEIREFLHQTSILERFNADLCEAVTQNEQASTILNQIEQNRLFLIPLDKSRHWYRYHHLFAEQLKSELQQKSAFDISLLHKRASNAFQKQGLLAEAIKHAFEGNHIELAAELIGDNVRILLSSQGIPIEVWRWFQRLPKSMIESSPKLMLASAWIRLALFSNHGSDFDDLLTKTETLLNHSDGSYAPDVILRMEIEIAMIRNQLARLRGHLQVALAEAERANDLMKSVDSYTLKMSTRGALTLTHFLAGNINKFVQLANAQLDLVDPTRPRSYAHIVLASYLLYGLHLHGQLSDAEQLYEEMKPFFNQQTANGLAIFNLSWGLILYEKSHLDEAETLISQALEQLRPLSAMQSIVEAGTITLANTYHAQGKSNKAIELLTRTQRQYAESEQYAPLARIEAAKALIHLRLGNLTAVEEWIKEHNLQSTDDPTYLDELDYLVLARYFIATNKIQEALSLLGKIETNARQGDRVSRQLTIHLLRALSFSQQELDDKAQESIALAIQLGQTTNYFRTVVDEGEPIFSLLVQNAKQNTNIDYVKQLKAFSNSSQPTLKTVTPSPNTASLNSETLTERELSTLRYLASDLSVPEIADQMVVAPSTIRTYIKRIYSKLDVHSRIEAVNRARSLDLLN